MLRQNAVAPFATETALRVPVYICHPAKERLGHTLATLCTSSIGNLDESIVKKCTDPAIEVNNPCLMR